MTHPTGAQHAIRFGAHEACVTEVGAGLRSYRLADWQVIDGFDAAERCTGGRGQILCPWPNRITGGRYGFEGVEHQLPLTEPQQNNAIHGLVRWANWTVVEHGESRVELGLRLHAQPGWPWVLDLRVAYALDATGLRVETTVRNSSSGVCPFGLGTHPYLSVGGKTIDGATLHAPGTTYMVSDERQIPLRAEPVAGTPYDFTEPRPIGDARLDTGYGELRRDDDGLARVTISAPDRRAALWMDAAYPYLMLFTGDALSEPERRRRGLGVEPMSCAPNAFNSGDGLQLLEPGESRTALWGITPERG